jgi:hypothetical protein
MRSAAVAGSGRCAGFASGYLPMWSIRGPPITRSRSACRGGATQISHDKTGTAAHLLQWAMPLGDRNGKGSKEISLSQQVCRKEGKLSQRRCGCGQAGRGVERLHRSANFFRGRAMVYCERASLLNVVRFAWSTSSCRLGLIVAVSTMHFRFPHPSRNPSTETRRWKAKPPSHGKPAARPGVLPQGLGQVDHHRGGGGGCRDQHPAVPAGHRARMERLGFRRRARRTDVPKIVDWHMDGKLNINDLITHTPQGAVGG